MRLSAGNSDTPMDVARLRLVIRLPFCAITCAKSHISVPNVSNCRDGSIVRPVYRSSVKRTNGRRKQNKRTRSPSTKTVQEEHSTVCLPPLSTACSMMRQPGRSKVGGVRTTKKKKNKAGARGGGGRWIKDESTPLTYNFYVQACDSQHTVQFQQASDSVWILYGTEINRLAGGELLAEQLHFRRMPRHPEQPFFSQETERKFWRY